MDEDIRTRFHEHAEKIQGAINRLDLMDQRVRFAEEQIDTLASKAEVTYAMADIKKDVQFLTSRYEATETRINWVIGIVLLGVIGAVLRIVIKGAP